MFVIKIKKIKFPVYKCSTIHQSRQIRGDMRQCLLNSNSVTERSGEWKEQYTKHMAIHSHVYPFAENNQRHQYRLDASTVFRGLPLADKTWIRIVEFGFDKDETKGQKKKKNQQKN